MRRQQKNIQKILKLGKSENFLKLVNFVETLAAKVLTVTLLIVILIALVDLIIVLSNLLLFARPIGSFNTIIIELFGLFLNVLIALELLENITAYLRKHIFQVELVIATSLIAVARKIIIFDLGKYSNNDLVALAIAIFALSVSYWLVKSLRHD